VFEEDQVTIGKIKGSQQIEDPWHPLTPGRPLSPTVHSSLLEIGSMFQMFLSGIIDNPGVVDIKAFFT
jgi:hypothetical protein